MTVGRGDTAWSLATDHLGDGARWREIWEANRTRTQPDGAVWADEDQPVEAGWTLVMPGVEGDGGRPSKPGSPSLDGGARRVADAEAATPPVQALAAAPAVAAEVTVQSGDNFWDLAEGQLTEAWGRAPTDAEVVPHWQALVETNRQSLVPPGDPDLIHPGQVFSVPTPPAAPEGPGPRQRGRPRRAGARGRPRGRARLRPARGGARPADDDRCADDRCADDRVAYDDRGTDDHFDHRPDGSRAGPEPPPVGRRREPDGGTPGRWGRASAAATTGRGSAAR